MSGWLLVAIGIFGLADSSYAVRIAEGSWTFGTVMDGVWVVGAAVAGLGAGAGPPARSRSQGWGVAALATPLTGAVIAVALLGIGTRLPLAPAAVALAIAAAFVALLRLADAYLGLLQLGETREQALTDDLTGLMNRRGFYRAVEKLIDPAGKARFALLLIDLDRFKAVNDAFGHAIGDRLLRGIALRLEGCVPEDGLIARLGGDEFAAAVRITPAERSDEVARAILASLAEPVIVDGHPLQVDASIGVAIHPVHGTARAELLRRADLAMYLAKRTGVGVHIHQPGDDAFSHSPAVAGG